MNELRTHDTCTLPQVAARLAVPARPVVLIDGGAGAGKTTLASELATAWPHPQPQVVSLDAIYPGWNGLDAGSAAVHRDLLATENPGYWHWDWRASCRDAWVPLDPSRALIIEGCGALTPANRARATAGIWIQADPDERRLRALARDGAVFATHWDAWAAQEQRHWRHHQPRRLAEWVWIDGRFSPGPGREV